MRMTRMATAVAVLVTLLPAEARPQTPDYPQLTTDDELRLAISAGPLNVSQQADVYVMGTAGFERAIAGSNGWACLVVRSAGNRGQLAPHCLNPQAVTTVLPAFMHEAEMQARGMDATTIDTELRRQFAAGELALPSGPAYAYMLSEGQRLGPNLTNYRPHFMLYVPFATNAAVGGDPSRQQFPFVGPYENHPLSTVVVLMTEFVSPRDVVLPRK
jgi:hypothetical protein